MELRRRLPSAGDYVLVMEYSSEEELPQTLSVTANVPGARRHHHGVTLLHCRYRQEPPPPITIPLLSAYYIKKTFVSVCVCVCTCSFLCRAVAIDDHNRVAVLSLPADTEIRITSERATFFLVRAAGICLHDGRDLVT